MELKPQERTHLVADEAAPTPCQPKAHPLCLERHQAVPQRGWHAPQRSLRLFRLLPLHLPNKARLRPPRHVRPGRIKQPQRTQLRPQRRQLRQRKRHILSAHLHRGRRVHAGPLLQHRQHAPRAAHSAARFAQRTDVHSHGAAPAVAGCGSRRHDAIVIHRGNYLQCELHGALLQLSQSRETARHTAPCIAVRQAEALHHPAAVLKDPRAHLVRADGRRRRCRPP